MPAAESSPPSLVDLPAHPQGLHWPTLVWPVAEPGAPLPGHQGIEGSSEEASDGDGSTSAIDVEKLQDQVTTLFSARQSDRLGRTRALVVVHHGRIVAERYAPGTAGTRRLISWSTAKSMLHALVGILVGEGRLDLDAPAPVPEWAGGDDPRAAITLRHLLEFRSGLAWSEDYVDGETSDVIAMLFGDGQADTAKFATAKPLAHPPGTDFCYSSGTSNIISRIVGDVVADAHGIDPTEDPEAAATAYEAWVREVLFDPIGMRSAQVRFDEAGTFIASSYCEATARDFARFAYLYLRDGTWDGRRLLPEGWVDQGRAPRSVDDQGIGHGAHWWRWDDNPWDAFSAWGYEGQYFLIVPTLDLLIVRLGVTEAEARPALRAELTSLASAFAP